MDLNVTRYPGAKSNKCIEKSKLANHFSRPSADKDELLFSLDVEEVHVRWFRSSGLSENISEHGCVSAKHTL